MDIGLVLSTFDSGLIPLKRGGRLSTLTGQREVHTDTIEIIKKGRRTQG